MKNFKEIIIMIVLYVSYILTSPTSITATITMLEKYGKMVA
jgi:uncharacterized membrane protein